VATIAAAIDPTGTEIHGPGAAALTVLEANGWSMPDQPAGSVSRISLDAKIAALEALGTLPPLTPVASVAYNSSGRLLVIADSAPRIAQAVEGLDATLTIAVLWTGASPAPVVAETEIVTGKLVTLTGYLGEFALVFEPKSSGVAQTAPFDLVLDLRAVPVFRMHQPPQGYFHAVDGLALARAHAELPEMIGEFEKPKFFAYKESICAHSRSKKTGCNKCIEICSANAISSAGDMVKVDPHLCMGCGACATVCPSGAMSYQYPLVSDRGAQLKTLLNTYRVAAKGQGATPILLFHNATDGRDAVVASAQAGVGLPMNVLPLEAWHVASTGLDVLLGAIAYGAGHVAVLAAGSEAPEYVDALKTEMALGETILHALGFAGSHFSVLEPKDGAVAWQKLAPGETVPVPAGFNLSDDKRNTLEFAIEHFMRHAKIKPEQIVLPAKSLFGTIKVDKQKCTMCLACAGACPESALMDGGDIAQLKFLERNCVQCGLCQQTCPENAISLLPRLLLTDARKTEVVLNDAEPFDCISCGKTLGTKQMIDNMLGKLAGHSMFQGEGKLKRLQMCADCRVVDMMSNKHEYSILAGKSPEQH
jgi:ferredoxin